MANLTKQYLDYDGLVIFLNNLKEYIADRISEINGSNVNAYAKDEDNPLHTTDPDGYKTIAEQLQALWEAIGVGGDGNLSITEKIENIIGEYVKAINTPTSQTLPLQLKIEEGTGDDKDRFTISLEDNGLADKLDTLTSNRVSKLEVGDDGGAATLSIDKSTGDVKITINSKALTERVETLESHDGKYDGNFSNDEWNYVTVGQSLSDSDSGWKDIKHSTLAISPAGKYSEHHTVIANGGLGKGLAIGTDIFGGFGIVMGTNNANNDYLQIGPNHDTGGIHINSDLISIGRYSSPGNISISTAMINIGYGYGSGINMASGEIDISNYFGKVNIGSEGINIGTSDAWINIGSGGSEINIGCANSFAGGINIGSVINIGNSSFSRITVGTDIDIGDFSSSATGGINIKPGEFNIASEKINIGTFFGGITMGTEINIGGYSSSGGISLDGRELNIGNGGFVVDGNSGSTYTIKIGTDKSFGGIKLGQNEINIGTYDLGGIKLGAEGISIKNDFISLSANEDYIGGVEFKGGGVMVGNLEGNATNSSKLGDQLPSYYAKQSDLTALNETVEGVTNSYVKDVKVTASNGISATPTEATQGNVTITISGQELVESIGEVASDLDTESQTRTNEVKALQEADAALNGRIATIEGSYVKSVKTSNTNTGTQYVSITPATKTTGDATISINDTALKEKIEGIDAEVAKKANTADLPSTLPNPKSVTIKWKDASNTTQTKTYTGSDAVTADLTEGVYYAKTATDSTNATNAANAQEAAHATNSDKLGNIVATNYATKEHVTSVVTPINEAVQSITSSYVKDIKTSNTNAGTKYVTISPSTAANGNVTVSINDATLSDKISLIDNYTINDKKVSTSPTLTGQDINLGAGVDTTLTAATTLTFSINTLKERIEALGKVVNLTGVYEDGTDLTTLSGEDGDFIIVGNKEYVFWDGSWYLLGDTTQEAQDISDLAAKYNSHTHKFTAQGTVESTFKGNSNTTSGITGLTNVSYISAAGTLPTTSTKEVASKSHTHTTSITAQGSVNSTFTGTAASHDHVFEGNSNTTSSKGLTVSYAAGKLTITTAHTHTVTPTGTVKSTSITPAGTVASTFTGTAVSCASGAPSGTIEFNAVETVGTLPTYTNIEVASKTHTHTVTPTGTITSTFTGTEKDSTDPSSGHKITLSSTRPSQIISGATNSGGSSGIDYSKEYLTFETIEDSTFKLTQNSCEYSLDEGETWVSLAAGTNTPTVPAGSKIMFKATNPSILSYYGIGTFSSTGKFNVEGNIMSMLYGDNFIGQNDLTGKSYVFYGLFKGCTNIVEAHNLILPATTLSDSCYRNMLQGCINLTTIPQLLATTLAPYCYNGMFSNCTSLTTAPELPATTLATYCYTSMFSGCKGLTTAPELPITTLVPYCYNGMFSNCTSLTTAPELPATTLATYCYSDMFSGCTSLTTAPELPATTLRNGCYNGMFSNCTSLTTAPELPATTLADSCYRYMFNGCTSLTTAPELPATTLASSCYYYMFYGCSSLNNIVMLATDISAQNCLYYWVYGVASTGAFVKHPDMTSLPSGKNGIPNGWEVENC